MDTKIKVARLALLGAVAVFFLFAIGCGDSGQSDAGANLKGETPKNAKKGAKHDAAVFISPT